MAQSGSIGGIMESIAMVLRKPPYGDINAAEAVRHAIGAFNNEMKVSLILIDGGILLARKGQDNGNTGFTNLEGVLKAIINMEVEVFAENLSLIEHNVKQEDMVDGVTIVDIDEISALLKKAAATMIF
jgi:tRNA 2-thiouridine synthesizing protein D